VILLGISMHDFGLAKQIIVAVGDTVEGGLLVVFLRTELSAM